MSKISLIIPVYNESENLRHLTEHISRAIANVQHEFEIILVNDGSADDSFAVIQKLSESDRRIIGINLSRNFGKEAALSAGIHACSGDACIMMDADLQHPVELIPEFIAHWEKGADVVIGMRKKARRKGIIKKIGSKTFYRIMKMIAETHIDQDATDYRLLDRKVINEYNKFTEHNRIVRGLIDWLGFQREYVYFVPKDRLHGTATYSTIKLFRLAVSSFIAHSLFPLKLSGYLGICIILLALGIGGFVSIEQFLLGDPLNLNVSGTAFLAILILFLVGIILSSLGLIALYIANINAESINRPLYSIRERTDIPNHREARKV